MSMTVEQAKQAVAEKWSFDNWQALLIKHFTGQEHPLMDVIAIMAGELEKHRWIPVEEKLPKPLENVEVIGFYDDELKSEPVGEKSVGIVCFKNIGHSPMLNQMSHYEQSMSGITHWRYLHELP